MKVKLSPQETLVIIALIDMFQFDGAHYGIDGIDLDNLKKKLGKLKSKRR